MRWYLKAAEIIETHAVAILFLFGVVSLNLGLLSLASAQTGGEVFQSAAVNIACKVLPGSFGAMVSAFSGIFALVAAAMGAYRGAWTLVFVSVGCYIAKDFISVLFGDTMSGC